MDVADAIKMVDGITYKPGWTFSATKHDRFANSICFQMMFRAPDSDSKYAPDYTQMGILFPRAIVQLEGKTDLDVAGELLRAIIDAELHEIREFFSVWTEDNPYFKPFHPHNDNGQHMWAWLNGCRSDAEVKASIFRDLMYGNA